MGKSPKLNGLLPFNCRIGHIRSLKPVGRNTVDALSMQVYTAVFVLQRYWYEVVQMSVDVSIFKMERRVTCRAINISVGADVSTNICTFVPRLYSTPAF
jgi:hypothetical protein